MDATRTELLEWDAGSYDDLPLPHLRWGRDVVERLELVGSETVLDLGCGTGRDAQHLLEQLPSGRVVAVDGSVQMLDQLRSRLTGHRDRLTVLHADLRRPLQLRPPLQLGLSLDAAISVATLHWLPDHAVVFGSVAAVLRPGGRFVAECGGQGNIAAVRRALRAVTGEDGAGVWNFAGVAETRVALEAAGLVDPQVALVSDPARLERGDQLEAYLATVVLGAQLRALEPERRPELVREVAAALPEPTIDYVRLQISATRG
ncbi:trans-aconitate 2-methyltransferase [Microlunatus panaciterrae]|uniref:Trans-aconitate 2-methyltransferase n=1 Tax=Microlunatus panaciterrae TaxID=400768 RepID=A0ABS2RIL1_9ACTN|nr:class I SAM-dependent methyltransferase [Microlunatus panaciterrae]MBM7798835.1 trans-aconitate 2-methyltransferase [Microlunatus panaciterrae]